MLKSALYGEQVSTATKANNYVTQKSNNKYKLPVVTKRSVSELI